MKTTSVLILSATALAAAAATVLARPAEATLTLTEKAQILYLKQEEKLARDVYQVLAAKWGLPAFTRIAASEQTHMNAVDGLITRYGLADTTPTEPGRFSIPELQSLYGQLVTSGTESVARAIEAGILIEETDIADLEEVLAATRQPDITRVFSNLLAGSRNHLRAFTALAAGDTTVCTQAGAGRCAGMGQGQQAGRGMGRGQGMAQGPGARRANCGANPECPATCDGTGGGNGNGGVCPLGNDTPAGPTGGNGTGNATGGKGNGPGRR